MMEPLRTKWITSKRLWMTLLCLLLAAVSVGFFGMDNSAPAAKPTENKTKPTPDAAEVPAKPKPVHLSQHVVEYHIGVSYDENKQTLIGEETVTWKHPGKKPVSDLYFHLYPNAFRSLDTTFMKESGGKLRDSKMKNGSFASMSLSSIKTMEGEELNHRLKFVQPDDGNDKDQSLAKLRLPESVAPGESITLSIRFAVQLPQAFARMGVVGDFVMAGQWFPKLAVYEQAGTRGRDAEGWSLHQYHGNSEFYSDFGIYNVAVNVPESYTVAASGFPTKPAVKKDGRKTYQFYADDVHDFAWAASPNFIYAEEGFSDKYVPGVKIKLYLDPKHERLKDRYMRAAKLSLSRYSEWYGKYPYSTLTIVVPPEGGSGTGGMEYPTLITAWSAEDENPGLELERVVAHEIAHQYWYGMVATNEIEEAWLDEAFTTYSEFRLMQAEYDQSANLPYEAVQIMKPAPLKLDAWKYIDHHQYASNVYIRGKLVLLSIEREIGSDLMRKVLKTYFNRYKFKHPSTANFQKTLEDVTKKSWKSFFDQFVYGRAMLDYAVDSIQTRTIEKDGRKLFEHAVKIVRNGGYHEPVPLIFYFEDDTAVKRTWPGDKPSVVYKLTSDKQLKWVTIDPEFRLLMENKPYNNILQAEVNPVWKVRWNILIGKTIEALLGWSM